MKRRGTSRRQVLDLDTNSSSPKRSWQTKYQQIYIDHLNNSSAPTATTQVAPAAAQNGSGNRLPQLVGYTSDSEGDEPKKPTGDIDSKVQDFLKEISDIVPSVASNPDISNIDDESSRDSLKKPKSKSKKVIGPALPGSADTPQPTPVQISSQQPTIAWQECYDENSGCYYFWNMETNEVTWEMPEALRAYHVALEQWNTQQLLLAQQAVGGAIIPGFTNQPSNQQQQKKQGSNKLQEKSKNKRSKPADSDSEDDKIELITSYGPNSDEDDSDSGSSHSRSLKKKKFENSKSLKKEKKKEKEITIGPQLPPGYVVPVKVEEAKPLENEMLCSKPEKDDVVPKEPESKKKKKKEIVIEVKSIPQTDKVEIDTKDTHASTTQQDANRVNALQRLKHLKNKTSDCSSSEDSDTSDSNDSKKGKIDKINNNNEENEDEEEEDDDVEDSILERLKNQAKILKELGGEIPEEIKELIDTNSDSEKDRVSTPPNEKEESYDGKELLEEPQKEIKSEEIWPNEEKMDTTEDVSEKLTVVNSESMSKEVNITENPSDVVAAEVKEVDDLQSASLALPTLNELNKKKPTEKAPTSFSLIAGYGNEDDSEPEEDRLNEDKVKINVKPAPLFPIIHVLEEEKNMEPLEIKVEKPSVKNANMKVIKLSAKAKELIHSSTTTEKARATEFVATSEGLKPALSVVKENEVLGSEPKGFTEPVKKVSRKKRLEVPVFRKQGKQPLVKVEECSKEVSSDKTQQEASSDISEDPVEQIEIAAKANSTAYTSTWAYNSELKGGEYRGFGYGHVQDFILDQKPKAAKKGMIQFVKADTLMPKTEPVVNLPDKKMLVEETKQEDESSSAQKEQTKELAQVITEKVRFLCEGKDVVPPVQVMAIQLETLMMAHNAGGLSVQYMRQWLTSLGGQLASLEQAAAPQGWLCQWDRSYKRYFYRNEATGRIQWEYPEVGVNIAIAVTSSEPPPPPLPSTLSQGGEEAMELCDSPPPPQPPVTPPPPRISISRTPSPTIPDEPAPPLPPLPPPPPVISEQPPLPPLPPSESPPPPPLPPSPPPPPPPPIISIAPGEPLPPGVDMTDELFEGSRPPLPAVPPLPPKTPPPPPPPPDISEPSADQPVYSMGYDVPMPYDTYQIQPVPTDYGSGVYPYTGANSGGGDNYVIARPPASNPVPPPPVTSLATELDSFYSEVAALDPPLPLPEPSPSPPPPPVTPPPPQPQVATTTTVDMTSKKKKKTKLAPGLTLKKKGVSSLVAKWQQVQQDVRREAENDETQL